MSDYRIIKLESENGIFGQGLYDTSGQTVTFSGLTVSDNLLVSGIISGDGSGITNIQLSGATDSYVTGVTMNGNILELGRNQGLSDVTVNLSQFLDDTNFYVTGGTVTGTDLILGRNGGLNDVTIDTSSYFDNTDTNYYVTGATLNVNNLEIGRNGGLGTISVDLSTYLDNTDNFITGGTMVGNTLVLDRTNALSAVTVDMSQFVDSFSDTFVTGFTYNNANLLTIGRNQGLNDLTTNIGTFTGVTVNGLISGSSISINGGEEMTRIPSSVDFQLFGNQSSSGVIEYTGGLSANSFDSSKFDLGLVRGWLVDNTTTPSNPGVVYVDFSGSTGEYPSGMTLTYLATNPVTYIGMTGTTSGDIIQSTSPFSYPNHRDTLILGVVVHTNNTSVTVINNAPEMAIDPSAQYYDLIQALGFFNIGHDSNVFSANGGNLNMDKTGGDIFAHSSNYTNDPKNPHIKTLTSGSSITFRYRLRDSNEFGNTTEIDPNNYDFNGVLTTVPDNQFTVQRVGMFTSNDIRLQYGQNLYGSIDDAEASLSTETFVTEPNIEENGLLRGFVIVKQDTTDLSDTDLSKFINANHNGDAQETVVGNVHRTEILNHGSTGLRTGGLLSADSSTTFKVSSGSGVIINNSTDPSNPSLIDVIWPDITGNTLTSLSGDVATVIMMKSDKTIQQFPLQSPPSQGDKRDKILLGVVAHSDKVTITNLYNGPIHIISPINQHEDLTSAIGTFSINGNFVSGVNGTLELEKSAGSSFYYGGNYQIDKTNPSVLDTILLSGSSTPSYPLVYAKGTEVIGLSGYTIDGDNYDPSGSGVITPLGTNKFTAHRIWHLPINNLLVFQYGQVEYNSLALAIDGFSTENFVQPPGLNLGAYLISVVITKEGVTDLSDIGEAKFIQQGKFAGVGGGGGSVADTLQSAYTNSSSPEIVTDTTRGAVDYRIGTGTDSDDLVTFQQTDSTINAYITGEGNSSFNNVSGSTFYGDGSNLTNIPHTTDTNDFVTGATLNGNLLVLNRTDQLSGATVDLSSLSGGDGISLVDTITANENLVSGDLVYLDSSGWYSKADRLSDTTSSTELRIVTETITSGSTGSALVQGQFTTTGLTQSNTYWVDLDGTYVDTQPNNNGDIVRYIGTALNSTTLEFNPDELYIEISTSPGSGTNPQLRNVTTSGNILGSDYTVNVTTTSDTTQTLPTAVGIIGKIFNIKNSDTTTTSTVTLNTTGGQTIDGETSITFQFPDNVVPQSNGTNWILI